MLSIYNIQWPSKGAKSHWLSLSTFYPQMSQDCWTLSLNINYADNLLQTKQARGDFIIACILYIRVSYKFSKTNPRQLLNAHFYLMGQARFVTNVPWTEQNPNFIWDQFHGLSSSYVSNSTFRNTEQSQNIRQKQMSQKDFWLNCQGL